MNIPSLSRLPRFNPTKCAYQTFSVLQKSRCITTACPSLPSSVRAAKDVETLRITASRDFQRPEFKRLCWVGVYGDFADGTAEYMSNIDLMVIQPPDQFEPCTSDSFFLDDVLLRTWARPIILYSYLKEHQQDFHDYWDVMELLSSRTIYLRDNAARAEVIRLRQLAQETLHNGKIHYAKIIDRFEKLRNITKGVSVETFLALREDLLQIVFLEIYSIFDDLLSDLVKPSFLTLKWMSMDDVRAVGSRLEPFKHKINKNQDLSADREKLAYALWNILTTSEEGGLDYFINSIRKVLVGLEEIRAMGNIGENISNVALGPAKETK